MNPHNKDEFAKAFTELDATSEPEAIRNLIDDDEQKELRQSKSGKWYTVEGGELKQVDA